MRARRGDEPLAVVPPTPPDEQAMEVDDNLATTENLPLLIPLPLIPLFLLLLKRESSGRYRTCRF